MKQKISALLIALFATGALAADPQAFTVRVVGHGRPMILIPGLASPADVWNTTVDHYKDSYELHVVSFAGFAGQPPIEAPLIATARQQLVAYVARLDHPILIGHSLGGFLALAVASDAPKLVGPVISVDGVPFLAALMNPAATAENIAPVAASMREKFAKLTPEQYAAQNRRTLSSMITKAEDVEAIASKSNLSDPAVVGAAAGELMATDLRGAVGRIETPVLLIGAGGLLPNGEMRKRIAAAYEAQIASIPKHRFVLAEKARHFIMIDDPAFLFAAIDGFLHG
jgi:pimeloyl-ACP methyl ester carboxylesterase